MALWVLLPIGLQFRLNVREGKSILSSQLIEYHANPTGRHSVGFFMTIFLATLSGVMCTC